MNLTTPYDNQNIFAQIICGQAPAFTIYEDVKLLAFLDIYPQALGHTLIVPKAQDVRHLFDLSPEDVGYIAIKTQVIAQKLVKILECDGIEIQQFNGAAAGQTVFHYHTHLIPRWYGVPLIPHGRAPLAPHNNLEALAQKIKEC